MARVFRFLWSCCSSKANQWYRKDAISEDQSHESSESSKIGNGIQLTIILSCLGYTVWEVWQIRCQRSIQENTFSSSSSAWRFYEHCQVCKFGYQRAEHIESTWIHIRPGIRRRAKFKNKKTFVTTVRTVVALYARSSTTGRQLYCFQRVACLQSSILSELVNRSKFQSRDKPKTSTFASNAEDSSKPMNVECPFQDGQHPIWTWESSIQWK